MTCRSSGRFAAGSEAGAQPAKSMKPLLRALVLVALLCFAGCGGTRRELSSRMGEMISFIDVVKDKERFMAMYFDPDAVQKAKEAKEWPGIMAEMTDDALAGYRMMLVAAQHKAPVLSDRGQIATYALDGLPELSFVKVKGQWYLYHAKKK